MPAEDERELIGHVLLVGNRELVASECDRDNGRNP
jgi:hypothetical protein